MLLTASDVMTGWTIPCCYSQFRKVSPFAERLLAFSVFSISLSLFFFFLAPSSLVGLQYLRREPFS